MSSLNKYHTTVYTLCPKEKGMHKTMAKKKTYLLPSLISTSFVIRAHRKYFPSLVPPPRPFSKSTADASSLTSSGSNGCGIWLLLDPLLESSVVISISGVGAGNGGISINMNSEQQKRRGGSFCSVSLLTLVPGCLNSVCFSSQIDTQNLIMTKKCVCPY
jgi:hypothetical protein